MGIRLYFLLSLLFIIVLGLYVYSFNGQSFTLEALGASISLPIAIWVVVPVSIMVVASILHMLFYSFKKYMTLRAHKKDYELFIKSAEASLLNEEEVEEYKTPWFSVANKLINKMQLKPNVETDDIEEEGLKELIKLNNCVYKGEVVELKKYKLKENNPLVIQNRLNKLEANPKRAADILMDDIDKNSKLFKRARTIFLNNASYAEIERLKIELNEDDVIAILHRHVDDEDALHMENEALESLLTNPHMDNKSLNESAKILKAKLAPDGLLALFERLYNARVDAGEAFLYVLFELQMIDRAREVLENSDSEDFEAFKLLLFLRDHGKQCDTTLFL